MKNRIFLIALISLSTLFSTNAQGDYDLNIKTIKNDGVVGGDLHIVVQVRATATKGSFNAADFTLAVAFSNQALAINFTNTFVDASDYSWIAPFDTHYPLAAVTYYDGAFGFSQVGFGRLGATYPVTPLPISATWIDMIELRFTILSTDKAQSFISLIDGLTGADVFREVVSLVQPTAVLNQGTGFTDVTYNGTNWVGGNGLNGTPDITDASKKIVVTSGTAVLTGNVECDYFTVASGAQLVISPDATLRPFLQTPVNVQIPSFSFSVPNSDHFLIDADATGYGQYIGPSLPGTIKQWVGADAGWRNIAFPVSGGTAYSVGGNAGGFNAASTSFNFTPDCSGNWGNYINSVNVYRFNTGTEPHEWYGAPSAPTGGTEGYNIFTGAPFGTSGIATIKGSFLDPATVGTYAYTHAAPHVTSGSGSQSAVNQGVGCISEPVGDRQANWNGWALVANPFPSNLDVAEFAADNAIARDQIRIWNRASNAYVDGNAITGFNFIPPMQAFWIKLGDPVNNPTANILFQGDQRVFDAGTFQKYPGNQVSLIATNATTLEVNDIHLQFNSNATKGYDKLFDSYVLSQPGNSMPQLAFHNTYTANGQEVVAPLDYNTVYDVVASDSYPLRFWARSAGQFDFTVDTATMLPAWNVYIEDLLLAPNQYVNITHTGYSFNYDPTTDSPTRFVMHFAPLGSLDIKDEIKIEEPFKAFAYTDNQGIRVAFKDYPFEKVTIQVSNVLGQVLSVNKDVETDQVYLYTPQNLEVSFYLITVLNPDGSALTFKVTR